MTRTAVGLDDSVQLFKACADPTRLRLLHLLRDGERCVCELVAAVDEPQPKISRHLAYLRRAGLVASRKKGLWVHYRLARPESALQRGVLRCLSNNLGDVAQFADDRRRLGKFSCPPTRGSASRR